MAAKDVDITLANGIPQANPETVTLSKGQGHTVLWHNNTTSHLVIKFNHGTPFDPHLHPYDLGPGEKKPSGPVMANADTTWSYTISVKGGAAADPQVVINQ